LCDGRRDGSGRRVQRAVARIADVASKIILKEKEAVAMVEHDGLVVL
jgi:hypothetical protein